VKDEDIFTPNQTSATLLISYAEKLKQQAKPEKKLEAEKKYLLIYDIYIKANSYAWLNKVFFCFSIVFALAVLLWPSLSIIFKSNISKWEWVKSATVQTTVTGLAALMGCGFNIMFLYSFMLYTKLNNLIPKLLPSICSLN
jgi:pilus assembly protein TadC